MPLTGLVAIDSVTTSRLTIRTPAPSHVPMITRAINDPKVSCWLSRVPHPYREIDATKFIEDSDIARAEGNGFRFVIILKDRLIGGIGLDHVNKSVFQLGYWISYQNWGKGFATESVSAIIDVALKQMAPSQIIASCHEANYRSENVLLKNEFSRTGIRLQFSRFHDKEVRVIDFIRKRITGIGPGSSAQQIPK